MSAKLMAYFNRQPRIGTLSTASNEGKVDVAVFGSPRMIDGKTVVMGLGKNRSFSYLQQNPHAVYIILEPGKTLADWKGIRVYLTVKNIATSGKMLDDFKSNLSKVAGEAAAAMIHAAVRFEVEEIRPIVDMGQGWESSI
jgi:hypothetical protein